jgi:hypothetical protein
MIIDMTLIIYLIVDVMSFKMILEINLHFKPKKHLCVSTDKSVNYRIVRHIYYQFQRNLP